MGKKDLLASAGRTQKAEVMDSTILRTGWKEFGNRDTSWDYKVAPPLEDEDKIERKTKKSNPLVERRDSCPIRGDERHCRRRTYVKRKWGRGATEQGVNVSEAG